MNGLRGREGVSEESSPRGRRALLYLLGEYVAGVATAVLTALPIHALVDRDWDMVVAMIAGTILGSAAHLLVLALLGPVVGLFHVMAPGALIGMYGGMLFGMRDSMQAASWSRTLAVAVALGVLVVAAVQLYDRLLRADDQAEPGRRASP